VRLARPPGAPGGGDAVPGVLFSVIGVGMVGEG